MLTVAALKAAILEYVEPSDAAPASFPADMTVAAQRWMQAYDAYASAAADVSTDAVATKSPLGFKNALAALAGPVGSAHLVAVAFENAVRAYWTGATFGITTPPGSGVGGDGVFAQETSSVVATVTAGVTTSLLEVAFALPSDDRDAVAQKIAAALHAATTTAVLVLITGIDTTPAPTGPLAITNTGTIH